MAQSKAFGQSIARFEGPQLPGSGTLIICANIVTEINTLLDRTEMPVARLEGPRPAF